MLNLRAIGLKSGRLGGTSSSSLGYGDVKFAHCNAIVGNLGAPVSVSSPPLSADDDDFHDDRVLQEQLDLQDVSDDPFMEGIVMEME